MRFPALCPRSDCKINLSATDSPSLIGVAVSGSFVAFRALRTPAKRAAGGGSDEEEEGTVRDKIGKSETGNPGGEKRGQRKREKENEHVEGIEWCQLTILNSI